MNTHPQCDFDADDPCVTCFPYRHAADGCPTSERCSGIESCPDCQDVLTQVADTLDPGVYRSGTGSLDLIVGDDDTYTVL